MVIYWRWSRKLYFACRNTRNQIKFGISTTASKPGSQRKPTGTWTQPEGFDSGLTIYNSIMKCMSPLILRREKQLTWYACGPTVYASAHVGHASTYVKNDIIRRILSTIFDIDVTFVMGLTDIDDKIINRAIESEEDFRTIAKFYENEFFEDMANLNVIYPNYITRVTSYIPQILIFIQKLIDDGFAYPTSDGSVYFDSRKYEECHRGKLTRMKLPATDIPAGTEKRHSQDFALWKGVKANEPYWKSPWGAGAGRPGWHVECSAMASEVFGNKIDIHSGGADLLFPHHESELSQSNAFHCCDQWVNYWLHTGVQYCEETLQKSFAVYQVLIECIRSCDAYVTGQLLTEPFSEATVNESLTKTKAKVLKALSEDFHTPRAMEALIDHVKVVNKAIGVQTNTPKSRSPAVIAASKVYLENIMRSLGIRIAQKTNIQGDLTQQKFENIMDSVLQFRADVRDYARSSSESESEEVVETKKGKLHVPLLNACDKLRENLSHSGVRIKDHAEKSSWVLGENKKPKKTKN